MLLLRQIIQILPFGKAADVRADDHLRVDRSRSGDAYQPPFFGELIKRAVLTHL